VQLAAEMAEIGREAGREAARLRLAVPGASDEARRVARHLF